MAKEQQQELDENKHIRPRERARGQKCHTWKLHKLKSESTIGID